MKIKNKKLAWGIALVIIGAIALSSERARTQALYVVGCAVPIVVGLILIIYPIIKKKKSEGEQERQEDEVPADLAAGKEEEAESQKDMLE